MSISAVGSSVIVRTPEALEPKGSELRSDNDGDDGAKAAPTAAPPGQGLFVDKLA